MVHSHDKAFLEDAQALVRDDIPQSLLPESVAEAQEHRVVEIDSHALNFGPQHP
ncbi:MAG: hypothetical protein ABF946_03795 [Acetobacter papayae]